MAQLILNHRQIERKIDRLAMQIIENTYDIDTVYIGGIQGNGFRLAEKIHHFLRQHSQQQFILFEVQMNKEQPLAHPIHLSIQAEALTQQTVFLVDDVINSGKTMQYALIKILQHAVSELYTVVLVDRKHRKFPIKANFFGLRLSTTLQNHIDVSLIDNQYHATLS